MMLSYRVEVGERCYSENAWSAEDAECQAVHKAHEEAPPRPGAIVYAYVIRGRCRERYAVRLVWHAEASPKDRGQPVLVRRTG